MGFELQYDLPVWTGALFSSLGGFTLNCVKFVGKSVPAAVQADLFSWFGASFLEKNAYSSSVGPKGDPMSRKHPHLNTQHTNKNAPSGYQWIPKVYKIEDVSVRIADLSIISQHK